jgi:negative regulator of sigma E activity
VVAERLEAAMARRCLENAELEALWTSAALVRDSVLGDTSGSSSLAASLAKLAEEAENPD